jgi:hypothetical protein
MFTSAEELDALKCLQFQGEGTPRESSYHCMQISDLSNVPVRYQIRDTAWGQAFPLLPVDDESLWNSRWSRPQAKCNPLCETSTYTSCRGGDSMDVFEAESNSTASTLAELSRGYGGDSLDVVGTESNLTTSTIADLCRSYSQPTRTQVPQLSNIPLPKFASSTIPDGFAEKQLPAPSLSTVHQMSWETQMSMAQQVMTGSKVDVAVQVGEEAQWGTPYTMTNHLDQSFEEEEPETMSDWPSIGSVGHPVSCAEACKYYRKARSCKQGRSCTRCHLCERRHLGRWRRPRPQLVEDSSRVRFDAVVSDRPCRRDISVDTQELQIACFLFAGTMKSLGSIGHPVACGPACRYTWRKSGCKHGSGCLCCHLCSWSRMT